MKKGIIGTIGFLAIFFSISAYTAQIESSARLLSDFCIPLGKNLNVAEWKVGDYANYTFNLELLGEGSLKKTVTKDEGTSIWVTTVTKTPMGEQNVKTLHRKSDGKVLKLIVDDKEQTYQEPEIEILEQNPEEITVPAGTFKTIHVKAKDRTQDTDVELWVNPIDIPIGGIAKAIIKKAFFTVNMELTEYGHKE